METPSFTFRLERVRDLRERAEQQAREALTQEIRHRDEGQMLFDQARDEVHRACALNRTALSAGGGWLAAHGIARLYSAARARGIERNAGVVLLTGVGSWRNRVAGYYTARRPY